MPPKKDRKPGILPKDMVLSKMTGFPAWPSFVMPPDMIPRAILNAKKKTTNVCVIFIPDGDYNWMNEKLLEPLTPEKLQTRLEKLPKDKLKSKPKRKTGRTNNVADALIAADGLNFDNFMEELARHSKAEDDDNADDADEGPDDPGSDPDNAEDDPDDTDAEDDEAEAELAAQEALEEEEDAQLAQHTEKERLADKGSVSADDTSGIADDNLDVSSGGTRPSSDDESKENDTPDRKRPRNGTGVRKEAKQVLDDKKQNHTNGDKSAAPKLVSEKDRQHQLWLCRIKLQRSLIQRNQPVTPKDPAQYPAPTVDELLVARIILNRLADFPVTEALLRETKIHKVLKCILKDEDLEYPDSFRLHEKCEELLQKWKPLIESLKQEKQAKLESRPNSLVPEESELLPTNL